MSGVALVRVCAGRGLKACDSNGKSDPYVNFRLQSQKKDTKQRTKVIEKTLEPVWNEEFKLPFTTLADNIIFHVWDKDRFSNDSMGQVTLPLIDCTPGSKSSRWLKLDDVETGEILIEVEIPPGHYSTQPAVKDMLPLIPQTPSLPPLIEGSILPQERGFVIQEQFWSLSTHDNKIYDENGNFVLNVDGKAFSLHGRMTIETPQGQPLLSMGGKAFSLHATQCVFLPGQDQDVSEDKAILVVKAKIGNRFVVTRQGKDYFTFKFNWLGHKGVFTNAAGEVIGQVAARLFQHYQAQTFHLRCAAGTDSLAMLCAVLLADKIMDDRRRAQQGGHGGPHPHPGPRPMHF